MAIGIGIGIGFAGNGPSPSWLYNQQYAIFGADLIGLYIGESAQASTWPGFVGDPLSGALGTYSSSSVNGRKSITPAAGLFLRSATLSAPILSTFSVLTSPALPFTQYSAAVGGGAVDLGAHCQFVTGNAGASVLYSDGPQTYIDGTLTSAVTAGTHVYQSSDPLATSNVLRIGYNAVGWAWYAAHGCVAALSIVPSEAQLIASAASLYKYYRLPAP